MVRRIVVLVTVDGTVPVTVLYVPYPDLGLYRGSHVPSLPLFPKLLQEDNGPFHCRVYVPAYFLFTFK